MNDFSQRIANLSPEKRALFELRLIKKGTPATKEPRIPRREMVDSCPLSFAQQRLWFLDQLEPNNSFYNISRAIQMRGALDVAALEQSLNEIVRRHEVLRTTFSVVEGQPVQIIALTLTLPLPVVDLRELPEIEREAEARRLASDEARRPFDLAQGPLFRATLLRLSPEDHVLLLTMHHIVSDGWSMQVLFRELSVLYEARSTGKPSSLPELPIQYADFAVWQRQWLQGEVLDNQLAYWKQQLGDTPPVLELPADHPRPARPTYRGARQSLEISSALLHSLKTLSRQEGVTLFMTLLAAFQTLLHRYTEQENIVVGSPIANRNRSEIEGLIGFFVNTLALRTDLSGNPTFRELLGRVREVALGAYAHQELPFEKLVEELRPERDPSRHPLFQVMFIFQDAPMQFPELPNLTVSPLQVSSETARLDLSVAIVEGAEGLRGWFFYSIDLFDAPTITRMIGHFQTLLAGIVAEPDTPIAQLPLLAEAERHQLLVKWNDTQIDYPPGRHTHNLFEAQVEQHPEAIALTLPATPTGTGDGQDQQMTYRELNARANQLAHFLQKRGVGPEVLVGLYLERSVDLVVGLLGILKAGGAYVPMDPSYPQERLAFMLADTEVPLLLTQQHLVETMPDHRAEVVCLDTDWQIITRESQANPSSGLTPDSLVYVIYTSGSTGQPKGVLVAQRGLYNLAEAQVRIFDMKPNDRLLHSVSFSFDAATIHMFTALGSGATLCLTSEDVGPSGVGLARLLRDQAITHAPLPASALADLPPEELPALRMITAGAEACPPELVGRWAKGRRFLNRYGPTEATICATTAECVDDGRKPPIGRPLPNTQIYILDRHLQPVPIGVPGELHIGGVGLARGYLNQPALTAEMFIPNPYWRNDESGMTVQRDELNESSFAHRSSLIPHHFIETRLYKTGDLACYLPDGNIEFLGRMDHQIKIRGFRIEPGEIEAALGQHPALREAVVLARDAEHNPGMKRLVAYVVPERVPAPTSSELRHFLKQRLPVYMVPSTFITLDALPLTPGGKIDRRALPAPDRSRPELESVFVAPRTPLEEGLADIWAELLELEQVGIHDNFFELGGHSLLATQVISRIRDAFQVELPLRNLFETPTIVGLAEYIEVVRRVAQDMQAPVGATGNDREEIEL